MIEDARELSDGASLSADLCIVGAGAAGITIARALEGRGMSVIVLESGGFDLEDATDDLARGTLISPQEEDLLTHTKRVFGGTTIVWNGWCMPMRPEDFEPRAWIPESGWPIGYADLVPYYRRAQRVLGLGGFEYDVRVLSARGARPLIDERSTTIESSIFQFSQPVRFGTAYRTEVQEMIDVRVLLHANVVDLGLAGDRVSRVEVRVLDGPSFTVEADRFVLAMGSVQNARLLLSSDVANGSGLVGRYFMSHPHFLHSLAWVRPSSFDDRFYRSHMLDTYYEDGTRKTQRVQGMLSLSAEVLASEQLLDCSVQLTDSTWDDIREHITDPAPARGLIPRGGELEVVVGGLRGELPPHRDNRVTLADDRDALGVRRPRVEWQFREDVDRAHKRAMTILGAELGALGLGRLYSPNDDRGGYGGQPYAGGHHMGGTRMAARADDGVVDPDCRTFDVENLYIAGASIFRTVGRPNPTLTLVALAERLADHLAGLPYEAPG